MTTAPLARIQRVRRHFLQSGGAVIDALGPVSLDVHRGEFVCIVGPSGCGKSTLLRLLAGLLEPTGGIVELQGARGRDPRLAMVFQSYGIFPWKTVLDNVRLGLDIAHVDREEADRRAHDWIARLGLEGFEDEYPRALSGGMRQRVSIARALAVDPELLLMDEPFGALDAQLRRLLQEELLRIWQTEAAKTVAFVTHSLEEAILLGDRIVLLSSRPGRILKEYEVPFARPREPDIRERGDFRRLEDDMWSVLRGQLSQPEGQGVGS